MEDWMIKKEDEETIWKDPETNVLLSTATVGVMFWGQLQGAVENQHQQDKNRGRPDTGSVNSFTLYLSNAENVSS